MIRLALSALLLLAALATDPAAAQTAGSTAGPTAGNVGSATLRNGYPANGGSFALPSLATPTTRPGATTTGSNTTANSASSASGSNAATGGGSVSGSGRTGGGGRGLGGAGASAGAASPAAAASGNGNWVLCPPNNSSGLAPFLEGTHLSCAPD